MLKISAVTTRLYRLLGPKMLADITGVESFKEFDRWVSEAATPNPELEIQLREILRVGERLPVSIRQVRIWMQTPNDDLEGATPLQAISEKKSEEVLRAVANYSIPSNIDR